MTLIAAISEGGRVYMGADSVLTSGDHAFVMRDPKVYVRDGLVLGFCGSLRYGQLLALTPFPKLQEGQDVDMWVRRDVCNALQAGADARGFELGPGDDQDDSEGILGINGTIYVLDVGAVAYRPEGNYAAIGSGSAWAEGSLYSTRGKPRPRLTRALEAAETFHTGVRRPWIFASA